ncbi:uroporphyrinogen-III synthase [Propionibacterium cyclohexanicum]|uniref:Uroporphyrinogen-III synthase n=1 Tax=Propionibacterium cyclohexanicum TaxID=64702 RepID=A0A1H9RMF2_9ACTN|nr:uroporphyrinogen-III synthase [Propionibacterium cyclohexanicum]
MSAQRRADDLASALARRGAGVAIVPTLAVQRHADEARLIEQTRRLLSSAPDVIVVTTGFGLRGWIETADASGLGEAIAALLAGTRVLARGPKAAGALQQVGVRAQWVAPSESSQEILAVLLDEGVTGRRIAVQLDGVGDPALVEGLRRAGATVVELPVYRCAEPADPRATGRAARELGDGRFDAVAFTSAPGADGWLNSLHDSGCVDRVRARVDDGSLLLAAVGPQTAEPLLAAAMPAVWPERSRLGSLVRLIVAELSRRAITVDTPAGLLRIFAQDAAVADTALGLSAGSLAVLRLLASRPGVVVDRETILGVLPGESSDPHSAEAAVWRLRSSLPDPEIIATVARHGYRLEAGPTS